MLKLNQKRFHLRDDVQRGRDRLLATRLCAAGQGLEIFASPELDQDLDSIVFDVQIALAFVKSNFAVVTHPEEIPINSSFQLTVIKLVGTTKMKI